MYDATVAMTDIVTNFGSIGQHRLDEPRQRSILDTFRAADGWFVMQLVREHQFERLAQLVGHPEWLDDPRLADARRVGRAPRGRAAARHRGVGRRT